MVVVRTTLPSGYWIQRVVSPPSPGTSVITVPLRFSELPACKPKDRSEPWSFEEARQFLDSVNTHRLYPAFLMLMLYGMRRGEVLGLCSSAIDLQRGVIHIRQQLQQVGNEIQIGPVKTDAGQRDLQIVDVFAEALRSHHAQHTAAVESSDALVFTGTNTKPLWPRNFVRTFHVLRQGAKLRRIKLHYLRHTAATLLKNLGVPARDIQLILGHAHISTTQQIYQHGDPATQEAALSELGRVLLLSVPDRERCRQDQPSNAKSVVGVATYTSGGPAGTRTRDTLLKSSTWHATNGQFTSVIQQLRPRTNTYILGYVAVNNSRRIPADGLAITSPDSGP